MDYIDELYQLCETIKHEIADANEKIEKAGGKLSAGDVDYIDKLTHTLKSVKAVIAMMEGDDGEYSGRYDDGMRGTSYEGGYMGGTSYARGRGSNAKRDSMGRYASDGYSREGRSYRGGSYRRGGYSRDGFADKLRELIDEAPNEHIKSEMERLAEKVTM